jgi:hypothetical protein
MLGQGRRPGQVGEESQVLRYIPRQFKCARIFADLTAEQHELKAELREAAARGWRDQGGR